MARDERDPGPPAAGAGRPSDERPHEGCQAAHHGPAGLGQRVSGGGGLPAGGRDGWMAVREAHRPQPRHEETDTWAMDGWMDDCERGTPTTATT